MNWLDIAIVAAIGLIAYRAYVNGFVRELVSLSAVILAIPIAGAFYDDLYPKVEPMTDDRILASLISFLAIFVAVVVGGQVIAHVLKTGVRLLNFGAVDSLAGGAFGVLKGVLIVQTVFVALVLFPKPDIRETVDESSIARRLLEGTPLILLFLPGHFEDGLEAFLDGVAEVTGTGS